MHTPTSDLELVRRLRVAINRRTNQAALAPLSSVVDRVSELLSAGPLPGRSVTALCIELRALTLRERGFARAAARALFNVVCGTVEAPDHVALAEAA